MEQIQHTSLTLFSPLLPLMKTCFSPGFKAVEQFEQVYGKKSFANLR